ncbi:MAG: galactose mutarotase [Sedimentisphaerales bacterium]|nr:galactose mutarotase [Sedimentisphaerales bacterium]
MITQVRYIVAVCLVASACGCSAAQKSTANSQATITKTVVGKMPDGAVVHEYTLTNANGLEAKVLDYGATLTTVKVPDKNGKFESVTLYLDSFEDYFKGHPLFGSVVGRFANRIAGAQFAIDGVTYKVTPNAGANHIHGGREGFHKLLWQAESFQKKSAVGVILRHTSPDGNEGYPGKLDVTVTYTLTNDNELIIEYAAATDKPTVVNLTNHAYWNLAGAGSGDVLDHILTLNAESYLPSDQAKIPTGEIRPVKGTVMDFTRPQTIGLRIKQVEGENYDHCYVLKENKSGKPELCARVVEPKSGRVMEVFTTQPGVQLYTAKHLSSNLKTSRFAYGPYHGLCLETQHYPDAPNKPNFPSTVLRPGQTFKQTTIFKFSVQK